MNIQMKNMMKMSLLKWKCAMRLDLVQFSVKPLLTGRGPHVSPSRTLTRHSSTHTEL